MLLDRFTTKDSEKPTPEAAPAPSEEIKPETAVPNEPTTTATASVLPETPAQPVTVTSSETVSVSPKPAVAEKTVNKEVVAAVKPVRTEPYYTIIAGSFTSKRNALRLKRQLRKAGYADAFVIVPARRGQLYKVAAAGSADRNEAIANMAAIDQLAGIESWLYKN